MRTFTVADIDEKAGTFNRYRTRLFGIAYRMLGTRDDAEDIVQEAYIRWHKADESEIETPEAWLVTVTTRLAIDRLRKAAAERESYIGPWLPEPLIMDTSKTPEEQAELASDLSLAFMVMLERLSPVERAVFLLHDVFDCDYPEIARMVGKSEPAVRQIVSRARSRVRNDKPRFEADQRQHTELIHKFAAASYAGDEKTLLSLFADDIAITSDGGGVVNAARRTVYGSRRLARLFTIPFAKHRDHLNSRLVTINGEPGLIEFADGQPFAATTFTIENGKITAMYRVMNPNKLRALSEFYEDSSGDLSQTDDGARLG
jgi:RNA polymerase sigma-70 factor (ECF subfamily)